VQAVLEKEWGARSQRRKEEKGSTQLFGCKRVGTSSLSAWKRHLSKREPGDATVAYTQSHPSSLHYTKKTGKRRERNK